MGKAGFRELLVWQRAKDLAVQVYRISHDGGLARDFSLRDQVRRSAISVASNLAEGDERGSDKDGLRFFFMAKGSLAELRTQLQIAFEIGLLNKDIYQPLEADCERLGRMLGSLIRARSQAAHRPLPMTHNQAERPRRTVKT